LSEHKVDEKDNRGRVNDPSSAAIENIISRLKALGNPAELQGMASFGMSTQNRLGIRIPVLRKLGKELGRNHQRALELWTTGFAEARILASLTADPGRLTEEEMEAWVSGFDSWDVCDQVCMNLFDRTPLAWKKVRDWAEREEEFVKRAAFSLIACLAWHDKRAKDEDFIAFFPLIKQAALDERNFVKKAVNWALRHIGKRNLSLNRHALDLAAEILGIDSKSARWIASDAVRELRSEAVQGRLHKKEKAFE
jgi:3-methyladenine DNA glycosylase AlkD